MRHPEPQDYIKAYNSGFMSEQMMLDLLINYEYTFGFLPIPWDTAYVSGTWEQVEHAYYTDRLTEEQFFKIMEHNASLIKEAARNESR